MARQHGIVKLEGKVGDYSFYKKGDKHFVKLKGGVSGERIKTELAYLRLREHISEFGRASAATRITRHAFKLAVEKVVDPKMSIRLQRTFQTIVKADSTNTRGNRKVQPENLPFLDRFNFNSNAILDRTLIAGFSTTYNRVSGLVEVTIDPFNPQEDVIYPHIATHIRLFAAYGEIDFAENTSTRK